MDTQCHKKIESKPQKSTSETNAANYDNDDKEKIKNDKEMIKKDEGMIMITKKKNNNNNDKEKKKKKRK